MGKFANILNKAETDGQEASKRRYSSSSSNGKSLNGLEWQSVTKDKHFERSSMVGNWDERLLRSVNDNPQLLEIFKTLRSRILFPKDDRKPARSILVTSTLPGEGKSYISSNLAISVAQGLDQYALIVDCDLRAPCQAAMFGLSGNRGLSNYLRGEAELPDLMQKTSVNKLSLLASGKTPANPAELLSSSKMSSLVKELTNKYDDRIIVFDSPPALAAAETAVLAEDVDGVILVVRQGRAGAPQVKRVVELIGKDKIIGSVLNDYTVNYFERSVLKGYDYDGYKYY